MRDSATPTRDVPLRRLAILGLVFVAGILSCSKDITGPGSGRFARGLSWSAIFPPVLRSVGGLSSGVVNFTTVHVVLHHSDGTVALDTVVTYPSTADSITVSLSVRLLSDAPSSGEPMTVDLGYLDAAGDTVFKGGPISLVAAPAPPGGGANPPVQVPVAYTGPGASATSVAVAPKADTVVAGATFTITAVAKDAGGNALAGTPVVWTSLDTNIATITAPSAGSGVAHAIRGTARILAQLLTGPMDTAKVVVTLPASQIVKPATASGDAQTGTAGVALAQPIVTKVAASDGVGVAGTTVTFTAAGGNGTVSPTTAISDANGLAQTTWTLGTGVGAQSITAAAGTLTNSPLTYTATSTAGAATKLLVTTQPASTTAGSPLTLAVTAQDAHGNVATGFTGAVTLALGNTTTGAVLGGTVTVNAVAGVASFATPTVNKAFAGYTFVASSGTLAPATTAAFNITAAAATALVITTQPVSAAAGAPLSVVVTAQDAAGNVATGFAGSVTMALGTTTGGAVLAGTASVNAVAGVATFTTLSVNKVFAGYTLVASSGTLTPATTTAFNITASAAATLVVTTQPVSAAAGAPLSIVVTAQDAAGNVATGFTGAVTMALGTTTAGAVLTGTASVNAVAGVATFTTLSINKVFAGYTLVASSGTLTPATTTAFNITASAAASLVVTAQPQNALGGAILAPVTVTAEDASGNVVTSFTGAVTLALGTTTSGAVLGGTASVSAVAGVATFSTLTVNKRFNGYTLVASATGLANATTTAFNIATGPATTIVSAGGTGQTGTVNLALPTPIAVRVTDAGGNGVLGTTVTFATADGSVSQPSVATDSSGVAAVIWTLGSRVSPPADSMTATVTGLTNSPLTITATGTAVVAGPATKLVFSVEPSNAAALVANAPAIVVQALDVNNLLATSFTGNVTLAIGTNVGNSTIGGTVTVAAVAGVATFSTITLNKAGTGYTLVASATSLTSPTSTTFNITAGTAANLVKVTGDAQSGTAGLALGAPLVVQVTDASGNTVSNANVTFAVATGGGLLNGLASPAVVATNGSGQASVTWTLGVGIGAQSVTATSTGLAGSPATFTATAAAGSATKLAFSTQPSSAVAGVANAPAIVVQALDVNNLLATSFTGNVTLAIGNNPGTSTIGGTVTVAAVAGVATFSTVTLNKVGTGYTLAASATALTSATSSPFNITAAAAKFLSIASGNGQAAAAGTTLTPITVQVTDSLGNLVSGTSVTFAVATGAGSLAAPTTTTTTAGLASATWTLGAGAGVQSVTATSAGLTNSPVTFTATSSLAGQKTWTGAAGDHQWSNGNNWAPAGAPLSTDSVVVPVVTSFPTLSSAATVKALTLATSAQFTLSSAALTVNGTFDVGGGIFGTGSVVLASATTANARGAMAPIPLTVQGPYVMTGQLSPFSVTVTGSLDLNGKLLAVGNGGVFTQGSGTITMNQSLSGVTTTGPANFAGGDETGKLTAGLFSVGGSFSQGPSGNAAAFNAGSGSALTLLMFGNVASTLSMANPGNSIIGNLELADTAGVTANTGFIVNNLTLTIGKLNGTLGGTINGTLTDPLGNWAAGNISFATSTLPISASTPAITSDVTINNPAALLAGNVTINGSLSIPGGLTVNSHSLTINGDLQTVSGGLISMTNVNDVVTVNGNATFSGGQGLFSTGLLSIAGNFTQNTVSNSFNAGAGHTTRFTGTTPTISFANPTTSNFGSLQLATTGAVTFATDAQAGSVWLKTGATPSVTSGGHTVTVGGGLYDTTGGRWQASYTTMSGSAVLPRRLTSNVNFTGGGVLADSAIITGNVLITTSALGMNGHYMGVSGTFGTAAAGILQMTHANDSLVVQGATMLFNGGAETGQLTNGYIEFDGSTFGQNITAAAFAADAPHVTAFKGTGQQAISFANPASGSSHFGNLALRDTGTVLGSDIVLNGQLQTSSQASYHISASAPQLVTSNGASLTNVVFDNVRWKTAGTSGSGLFPSVSNVTFKNIGATTLPQFDFEYTTTTNVPLSGFTFLTPPTAGGSYVKVVGPDTLTMSTTSPALTGGFLSLSGFGWVNGWSNTATWLGVTNDWNSTSNWSTGVVPSATTDVLLGCDCTAPQTTAVAAVHNMTMNGTGIQLTLPLGFPLTVNGDLSIAPGSDINPAGASVTLKGNVATDTSAAGIAGVLCGIGSTGAILAGTGTQNVYGKFCRLTVSSNVTATGPIVVKNTTVADAGLTVTSGGNLTFNGHRVETDSITTTGTGAITMTNSADSLFLHGSPATFHGASETGLLTAGTIIDRAPNVFIYGTSLDATGGSQTFIMDTTFFQTLTQATAATPGHGLNNLTMKGTSSKGFSGDQWITGTLLFDATMVGPGNVQGSYNIHVNTLVDNSTGISGGAFQGSTALHITGTTPFNRDTLVVNTLYIDHGQTFALAHNLVTNYIVVDSNSTLSLNGHTVNLQGNYFTTQNGGILSMTNASDSLIANQLYFNGGSTYGTLTQGAINLTGPVAGAIYQGFIGQHVPVTGAPASPTAFASTGTRVWLNPSFSTFMEFANPGSGATGSHFWRVQATNGAPVNMLTNIFVDSLLLGEVNDATWQSDSSFAGVVRTITTNGIYNASDTLILNAVNLVLNDGAASTANLLRWTGFSGYTGTLFTQNRSTTTGASLDGNYFTTTLGTGGLFINNIGTAGLTLGSLNTYPFGPICTTSLLGGGSCGPPPP